MQGTQQVLALFNEKYKKFESYKKHCFKELDLQEERLRKTINRDLQNALSSVITTSRKEIYEFIDGDVKDDEIEVKLKNVLEENMQGLEFQAQELIKKCQKAFAESIEEILKDYARHIQNELTQLHNISFNTAFGSFQLDTDSGIDTLALFGGIGGTGLGVVALVGAANGWNPFGWGLLAGAAALGIIGSLIGVAKAVWKAFDSDYKKSEQKKAVNKILDDTQSNIAKNIEEQLQKLAKEVKNKVIEPIKERLNGDLNLTRQNLEHLQNAKQDLKTLITHINTKGELQ